MPSAPMTMAAWATPPPCPSTCAVIPLTRPSALRRSPATRTPWITSTPAARAASTSTGSSTVRRGAYKRVHAVLLADVDLHDVVEVVEMRAANRRRSGVSDRVEQAPAVKLHDPAPQKRVGRERVGAVVVPVDEQHPPPGPAEQHRSRGAGRTSTDDDRVVLVGGTDFERRTCNHDSSEPLEGRGRPSRGARPALVDVSRGCTSRCGFGPRRSWRPSGEVLETAAIMGG